MAASDARSSSTGHVTAVETCRMVVQQILCTHCSRNTSALGAPKSSSPASTSFRFADDVGSGPWHEGRYVYRRKLCRILANATKLNCSSVCALQFAVTRPDVHTMARNQWSLLSISQCIVWLRQRLSVMRSRGATCRRPSSKLAST